MTMSMTLMMMIAGPLREDSRPEEEGGRGPGCCRRGRRCRRHRAGRGGHRGRGLRVIQLL